jgi:hypothetical protein
MKTEFRNAIVPQEIRSLVIFDHKVFGEYRADWFDRDAWLAYDSWWLIVNDRKIGCCAFERHVDFQEDRGGNLEQSRPSGITIHRYHRHLAGLPGMAFTGWLRTPARATAQ